MPDVKSFEACGHVFGSKTAATRRVNEWLRDLPTGRLQGRDEAWASELLDRHPKRDEKVGPGLAWIECASGGFGGTTNCLWAVREDGSRQSFSAASCVTGSTGDGVNEALRTSIEDQILAFKNRAFEASGFEPIVCPKTGNLMHHLSPDAHADHNFEVPGGTFKALVQRFLSEEGMSQRDVAAHVASIPGSPLKRITELVLLARWRAFHEANAQLRLIHKSANLRG
jgi:hypothetical protein